MLDCTPDVSLTYNANDVLAISINPNDQWQYFRDSARYQKFHELYEAKFKRLFSKTKIPYQFNIEISEPIGTIDTSGPRLHLHGFIKLPKNHHVFTWLCDIMPDLLHNGRIDVHHIRDKQMLTGWFKYDNKQSIYMPQNSRLESGTNVYIDILNALPDPAVAQRST